MTCGKAIDILVNLYRAYVVFVLMNSQPDFFFFGQMQILCVLTHTFPINDGPYFNHYKLIELIPVQSKRNYLGCNQHQCWHKNSLEKIRTEPRRLNQRSIQESAAALY